MSCDAAVDATMRLSIQYQGSGYIQVKLSLVRASRIVECRGLKNRNHQSRRQMFQIKNDSIVSRVNNVFQIQESAAEKQDVGGRHTRGDVIQG